MFSYPFKTGKKNIHVMFLFRLNTDNAMQFYSKLKKKRT